MKILDFYIGSSFLKIFFLVIFLLGVLFSFFELLSQLNDVGRGSYGLNNAMIFVILTLPKRLLDLMPICTLLGGIIALGLMADHGELIAMQSCGMSNIRICAPVIATGMLVMLLSAMMGETVMPNMEQQARKSRAQALSGTGITPTRHGFWARRENSYIHIDKMTGKGIAADIDIFKFDTLGHLKIFTHAASANIQNNKQWFLSKITQRIITDQGILAKNMDRLTLESFLSADQVSLLELPPYSLSIYDLTAYIQALHESGQNADPYSLALWRKFSIPLTTGAMVLLSLSFVFGSSRNISAGRRITMGALVGVALYFMEQLIMQVGLLLNLWPFITAMIPVLLITGIVFWRLRISI